MRQRRCRKRLGILLVISLVTFPWWNVAPSLSHARAHSIRHVRQLTNSYNIESRASIIIFSESFIRFIRLREGNRGHVRLVRYKCRLSNCTYISAGRRHVHTYTCTQTCAECVFPDTPWRSGQDQIAANYNRSFLRYRSLL